MIDGMIDRWVAGRFVVWRLRGADVNSVARDSVRVRRRAHGSSTRQKMVGADVRFNTSFEVCAGGDRNDRTRGPPAARTSRPGPAPPAIASRIGSRPGGSMGLAGWRLAALARRNSRCSVYFSQYVCCYHQPQSHNRPCDAPGSLQSLKDRHEREPLLPLASMMSVCVCAGHPAPRRALTGPETVHKHYSPSSSTTPPGVPPLLCAIFTSKALHQLRAGGVAARAREGVPCATAASQEPTASSPTAAHSQMAC